MSRTKNSLHHAIVSALLLAALASCGRARPVASKTASAVSGTTSSDSASENSANRPTVAHSLTVYVVRHAEKSVEGRDPPLSSIGLVRAQQLAHVLSQVSLDAVYTTQYLRSQQTGKAVANASGVPLHQYAAGDATGLALALRQRRHSSGQTSVQVLVVGHSNTVDDIVKALGGRQLVELTEGQYDVLVAVHQLGGHVLTEQLRFGVRTP